MVASIEIFLWEDNCDDIGDKHNLYTLAWYKIIRPTCERELGIRKTKDINMALLTKQE